MNLPNSQSKRALAAAFGITLAASPLFAQSDLAVVDLPELYVTASHVAMTEPAGTFGSPVSRLDLNPQFDLQARNMAEAQGDVSIRGGIFENTGFRVGAATLMDPQTGHYFAEIPIAPEMLEGPGLLVATDNAILGFNSTVGTVDYSWAEIREGGSLALGVGDNGLNFQRFHLAEYLGSGSESAVWGAEIEASRSESSGTIENGDHDFVRYSGRVQRLAETSQTDLFAGYQSKYLAWPELYAAPYGSNESDSVRTLLLMVNHQQEFTDSDWETTAYFRRHDDHYLFNRFSDSQAFVHQTEVASLALSGGIDLNDTVRLNVMSQVAADRIESTTLENNFVSRSYFKASVLPEFTLSKKGERRLSLKVGASFDDTNRNSSKLSPAAELRLDRGTDSFYISASQSSQVAGYTAIGGAESGLFASNPDLAREVSKNLEAGAIIQRSNWSVKGAVFAREDADLVDWTFSFDRPSARSARNVDIDTIGLEIVASKRVADVEFLGSVTVLDKSEDYGDDMIDASFYALNYAKFRVTGAVVWNLNESLQMRLDNEYRSQRENLLREGDDEAVFTNLGLAYAVPSVQGLELSAAVENLWEDDFQEVPGTPGRGRQLSLGLRKAW